MNQPTPRRRKGAVASSRPTVKMTVVIDVDTHSRLAAAAALSKSDRSAYAVSLIKRGLKGLVLIDRRKSSDLVKVDGSASDGGQVDPDADSDAA